MLHRYAIPFFLVATLQLSALFFGIKELALVTKPFLMPALAVGLYFSLTRVSRRLPVIKFILIALAFSTAGDVLLQLESILSRPLYFYLGLAAFLIAQCMYVLMFKGLGDHGLARSWSLVYGLYFLSFLIILYPGMPLSLKIPVTIYGFVLTLMAWQSWRTVSIGKYIAVVGAILFVLSDSILAINKFKVSLPLAGFWVMATYMVAQYLIVYGSTRHLTPTS